MPQTIGSITFLVRDYEEALTYFTDRLRFEIIEDTDLGGEKRWIRIAPPDSTGTALLLARATTAAQLDSVGNQAGGRVFLFLYTADFWNDYHAMKAKGVQFLEEPRKETYGHVVVFQDLYGNRWDFLESVSG